LFLRDSFSGFEYVFTIPFVKGESIRVNGRALPEPRKALF
jgi:hypothetical protein